MHTIATKFTLTVVTLGILVTFALVRIYSEVNDAVPHTKKNSSHISVVAEHSNLASTNREDLFVIIRDRKFGYADRSGAIAIPPQFLNAKPFSEGLAAVSTEPSVWKYIDTDGEIAFETNGFQFAGRFRNELALAGNRNNFQFIDKTGQVVIDGPFRNGHAFEDGVAAVQNASNSKRWDFVNGQGKVLFGGFEYADSFDDRYATLKKDNTWYLADKTSGKFVTSLGRDEIRYVGPLKEERSLIWLGNDEGCYYVDRNGKRIVDENYAAGTNFSEGLAAIRKKGQEHWQYIDRDFNTVIDGRFLAAREFENGLAEVVVGNHRSIAYIDEQGQEQFMKFENHNESSMQPVELSSLPKGAAVYMVPLYEWQSNPNLEFDLEELSQYRIAEGNTNRVVHRYQQRYMTVFDLELKREKRNVDVRNNRKNEVHVEFR